MKKENLVKRLGKKVLPYLMVGALAFNYKCANVNEFVEPEPKKPVSLFFVDPNSGDAPLEVNFTSLSYAFKGDIKEHRWDFNDDGEIDLITSSTLASYTYENAGEHYASLIVEDSQGLISDKALEKIVVNENIISLGQIAFWSNRDVPEGGYNEEIYSGDIIRRVRDNNTELTNIKRLTGPGQDLEPAWSPNGLEILFTSHRTGGTAVWRMNADGINQRDITSHLVERARQADWGSNGLIAVAYRDLRDSEAGIGIINPDQNSFTPIYTQSNVGNRPEWPKWSPNCSEIAFTRYVNGNWEVYKMDSNGNNLTNLTNDPSIDGSPDWFPDGNYLLFKSYRFGSADLHLMDKNGTYIGRLTDDLGIETDPRFSSDGSKIIFAHDIDMSNPQIYIMNADGTGEWVQLTIEGANRYPAWKPKKD